MALLLIINHLINHSFINGLQAINKKNFKAASRRFLHNWTLNLLFLAAFNSPILLVNHLLTKDQLFIQQVLKEFYKHTNRAKFQLTLVYAA